MRLVAEAKADHQLDALNELVHDRWFDLRGARHDPVSETFRISFDPGVVPTAKRARFTPEHAHVLEVRNVRSVDMEDSEKVDTYDFNSLRYDDSASTVTIRTGIPLRLVLSVRSLDMAVLAP